MDTSKVLASHNPRNAPKHLDRHRRAYEAAGQIWPESLSKHLALAEGIANIPLGKPIEQHYYINLKQD